MGVKRRWQICFMALLLAVLMGCQARPARQSASASPPAASSEPAGAPEASEEPITVPEPIRPVAQPVEVPAVLPEPSEAEPGPEAESQSAPAATVLPSPETVVWLVEKRVFSLSEIEKNPLGAGRVIGYFENNSTEPVTLSPITTLERYDGANWVGVEYGDGAMPNWPTGSGPTPPGARFEIGGLSWDLYTGNLASGRYRFVKGVGSADYAGGAYFADFAIYAEFELI